MPDVSRFEVLKLDEEQSKHIEDQVVVEEPLEVRVNGESTSVTMRTPGNDFDLAVGLLWTEGIIHSADDIGTMAFCPDEECSDLRNIVNVSLTGRASRHLFRPRSERMRNSSCGLCGKATIAEIRQNCRPITSTAQTRYEVLCMLPARLRAAQANFARTGGIHAAGLFDLSGRLILLREDLGRHNALDKALGAALLSKNIDLSSTILIVSGRLGFEIAQKAVVAGIPIAASVSAPSSLAIELAHEFGMTAIGFLRGRTMNIYTHSQRIIHDISKHPA